MKTTRYPAEFEELWRMFDLIPNSGLGTKGNKARAYKRYLEKEINRDDFGFLEQALTRQVEAKLQRRAMGAFDPDFMQVEGWINNERWDDEISTTANRTLTRSEQNIEAARQFLRDDPREEEAYGGNVVELRATGSSDRY